MKQLIFKKKRFYLLYAALFASALLLFNGCRKSMSLEEENNRPSIERTKNWFAEKVVQPENKMLQATQNYKALKPSTRYFSRMHTFDKMLDWSTADVFKTNGLETVIIRTKEDAKPFANKNFEAQRYLIFYEDRSGNMQLSIAELISKKGEGLDATAATVSTAFANKMLRKNQNLGNLNASITFYDKYYNPEQRVQVTNGVSSEGKFNIRNAPKRTLATGSRNSTCGGAQTCETWYLVGFWYDLNTGQVIDYEILDQYEVCTGGDGPNEPPYGYTGDPITNDPPPPPPINPCENANVLAQNAGFVSKMQELQTLVAQPYESAFFMRPDGSGGTNYSPMNGGPNGSNFNFTAADFNGTTGFLHNHESNAGNSSIFSADDLVSMGVAVTQGNVVNQNTFTFGLVSPQGTSYLLSVNDLTKFSAFVNDNFTGPNSGATFATFSSFYNLMVNTSNTPAQNEANFVSILNTFNSGTGLTLLKGNGQHNQWQQVSRDASGNLVFTNC